MKITRTMRSVACILVIVRAEDLNYDPVETLQDVITYQETRAIKRSIPLYAADGETVIGSFTVDNSNVCANSF